MSIFKQEKTIDISVVSIGLLVRRSGLFFVFCDDEEPEKVKGFASPRTVCMRGGVIFD